MDPASLTPRAGPPAAPLESLGSPCVPNTAQPHTGHLSQPGDRTMVAIRYSQRSTPVTSRKPQERGEPRRELVPVPSCTGPGSVEQLQAWLPWQHHHNGVRMVLHGSPRWSKQGGAGTPYYMGQRGFHAPKPALKLVLQHLPGCMSTTKRNLHLALTHDLAFEAFCSNSGSQGFTIPSSVLGLGLPLPPHLHPSSTSKFLAFQPVFFLFYS